MIGWWIALAGAASPHDELLRWLDDAQTDPSVAMACSPTSAVHAVSEILAFPQMTDSSLWARALHPGGLTDLGIDATGNLNLLVFGGGHLVVDVGFSGGVDQAEDLVDALLQIQGVGGPTEWRDGWITTFHGRPMRSGTLDISLIDDRLTVRGGFPSARGSSTLRDIVATLDPAGDGCMIALDTEPGTTPWTGVAFVPVDDGPTRVRFKIDQQAPSALSRDPVVPIGGSSTAIPSTVITLGVPLPDLLLDPVVGAALGVDEGLVFRWFRRERIGAGATLALYGGSQAVVHTPVTGHGGGTPSEARIRRAVRRIARSEGYRIRRSGRGRFTIPLGPDTPLYAATSPGVLILGTRQDLVDDVASGSGPPWPIADLVHDYPLTLSTVGSTRVAGIPIPLPAEIGVRTADGLWDVAASANGAGNGSAALSAMVGALLVRAQTEMSPSDPPLGGSDDHRGGAQLPRGTDR